MSELHIKFGELLKLERERQGIALTDVSGELKISEENLLHIEAGQTEALPSDLYSRLFTRSYAEHLGIDYAKTLEAIREELGESLEPEEPDDAHPRDANGPGVRSDATSAVDESGTGPGGVVKRFVVLAGAIVGTFIVFMIAYQMFFAGELSDGDMTETDREPVGSTQTELPGAAESYNWDVPIYQPPDSILLTLTAREESWATVIADGESVLSQTLTPGQPYARKAKYRFRVTVGIPRVVDVTLDGQPAFLASAESGRIYRVQIDQANRDRFRTPPQAPAPAETALESASSAESLNPEPSTEEDQEGN